MLALAGEGGRREEVVPVLGRGTGGQADTEYPSPHPEGLPATPAFPSAEAALGLS